MKRLPLVIIVLFAIVAFAAADYFVNAPLRISSVTSSDSSAEDTYTNLTQMLVSSDSDLNYVVSKRDRTKQLFEKFDISSIKSIVVFKNTLDKKDDTDNSDRITIYEMQGEANQGRITYLNLKMKLIDQTDITGTINETNAFGYNSFFYNDLNNKNIGFLVVQVKDNLFGFQYDKKEDGGNFETVKTMVEILKHLNLLT